VKATRISSSTPALGTVRPPQVALQVPRGVDSLSLASTSHRGHGVSLLLRGEPGNGSAADSPTRPAGVPESAAPGFSQPLAVRAGEVRRTKTTGASEPKGKSASYSSDARPIAARSAAGGSNLDGPALVGGPGHHAGAAASACVWADAAPVLALTTDGPYPCPRCRATGKVATFRHAEPADCKRCRGEGLIASLSLSEFAGRASWAQGRDASGKFTGDIA